MNTRQANLLSRMVYGERYSTEVLAKVGVGPPVSSPATLRRDMRHLEQMGFVARNGENKGTQYQKTVRGALESPLDVTRYLSQDIDTRDGLKTYVHDLWEKLPPSLFSPKELALLDTATNTFVARSHEASAGVKQKEMERFVIELSWKSSRIEGNTYSLLDTERLLKEGVEAPGHHKDEAIMILNHKRAFQYILDARGSRAFATRQFIEDVHVQLVKGLGISHGIRRGAVGITGSLYRPPDVPAVLVEGLEKLIAAAERMVDPYSRALLALVGISYLQAFEDGNKRTARLMANALLIEKGRAPLSYRSVDETTFRESMLAFYEQLSLVPMKKIFIGQYQFACKQYLQNP